MRRNDEIFKSNRMPLATKRSKKKLQVLRKQSGQAREEQLPLMPSLAISLSSKEELNSKELSTEEKVLSEEKLLPTGTLDSTQLKVIKQDIRDNMDDFFGPLDIKRTRIDSVRNTGLLCRECVNIASQANQREDGIHIPHCKTQDCVNFRENRRADNFDFSEIEEDFGEDEGGRHQETV